MSKSAARFSAAVAVRVAVAAAVLLSLAGCGSLVLATADTPACVTPGPVSRADSFKTSVALTTASGAVELPTSSVTTGSKLGSSGFLRRVSAAPLRSFDGDRLLQSLRELVAEIAADEVGAAARREADVEADRAIRIALAEQTSR